MSSSTAQGQLRSGAANADLSRIEVAGVGQQIVHLDFDGASGVDFEGDFVVEDIDVPPFDLESAGLAGLEQVVIALVYAELVTDPAFADVLFTLEQPKDAYTHSTIYIGGTDGPFREHGSFTSIAEGFDQGNHDRSDRYRQWQSTLCA